MVHYCKECNKDYKSYQSLWNHNKKFHKEEHTCGDTLVIPGDTLGDTFVIQGDTSNDPNKLLTCKYCNRHFNFRNNRWKHEKICKTKEEIEKKREQDRIIEQKRLELEIKKEEAKIKKEEARIKREENENLRLIKSKPDSSKETAVTINNINKALQMQNSHNTTNIVNNNNLQLIQLGEEYRKCNIQQLLTNNEQMGILNSRRFALQKIIEILHGGSGKYKQFKTVIITNLRNKYVYKYDDSKKTFITASSDDVMKLLIDSRLSDLETIYDQNNHKISDTTKRSLERFINEMREPGSDSRKFEIEQIKMLLFNDHSKIMNDLQNDISLVLTVNEVDD